MPYKEILSYRIPNTLFYFFKYFFLYQKEIYYNLNYPSLNQPTVIIGAVNRPTSSSSFDIYSNYSSDYNPAVWIQVRLN